MRSTYVPLLFLAGLFAISLYLDLLSSPPPIWLSRSKEQPLYENDLPSEAIDRPGSVPGNSQENVTLVVASQTTDDTAWIKEGFPTWHPMIYVTNDPNAELTVTINKGREGIVYLTYIIDNYDVLGDVVLFLHANRYQWHNDDPLYDGKRMLQRLQIPYIKQQGYISLRCVWVLGCPAEIHPLDTDTTVDPDSDDASTNSFYKAAFEHLFPGEPVPDEVGATCCAQFAASAAKIRERPRSDYIRYRDWLIETKLKDDISGRILEYAWHFIFGQSNIFCPNAQECYCKTYGLCHLQCEDEGNCDSQYSLPEYSTLPEQWPEVGWDDAWRNVTEMRAQQAHDYDPPLH